MNYEMTNDTTFDKIEAWLSGQLLEAEARTFEAELAADAALAREVERHRRGREALDRLAEQTLQQDFAQWRESLDDIPAPPSVSGVVVKHRDKMPSWLRRLVGGALLLVLAGAVWFLTRTTTSEPEEDKKKETVPTQQKPDVPVADITPSPQPDPVSPPNRDKPQLPRQAISPQLIAMADTRLGDFRGSILNNYKDRRGEDDDENPFFTAGLKAFQNNDNAEAKQNLLQVPTDDPYFPATQEMLAWLFFQEKKYTNAAKCYELYSRQSSNPETDWRLAQFYLADYQHRKADFWKKMDEILNPAMQHRYRTDAEELKEEVIKLDKK